ncbi:MAG TPA: hypothetical protein VFB96_15115 [Pirellulaceae bacterium]|nr:hypothetical protein [Pirellulaceae bacterium]
MGLSPRRFVDLSFVGLFVWLIGFLMAGLSGMELLKSFRCGTTPTPISCAALGAKGPPGSHYITLTGFTPKYDGYVYWADEQNGRWTSVQIPLLDGVSPQPPVVANVFNVGDEASLREALSKPELTGVLMERGLRGDAATAIATYNPGVDPRACWLFHVGGKPQDRTLVAGLFIGGLALHTVAIFLFARPRPVNFHPSAMATATMSPLLMAVNGLHDLARHVPISRRVWGAIMFPPAIALAVFGGHQFWLAAQASADAAMESELIGIGGLLFGVSFTCLALSFLVLEPKAEAIDESAVIRPSPPQAR